MSESSADSPWVSAEPIYEEPSSSNSTKDSVAYAENHVTEDLHPAFSEIGIRFNTRTDSFTTEYNEPYDEAALLDSEKAFVDALDQFQQGVKPKYQSQIHLRETHSWDEVIKFANDARDEYTGVDKTGVAKKINERLRTFQTAAPAIQAWLKLLPSTSTYGSVVCGGFTIILEQAAVRLRQLRKETLNALEQIPLCIEKAEFFIRTYGYPQINKQVGTLYLAIIDALEHILGWYKRAAGLKFKSAFWRGPAYEEAMKKKMKKVESASQAMSERADEGKQVKLEEIRDATLHTKDQVGELKTLAVEARNHLYNVFKDTEIWQEALRSWRESRVAKEARKASRDQAILEQEEENRAARKSLLARLGTAYDDSSRDMENVLSQITSTTLGDQDRVETIIQDPEMQTWLLNPRFGALLVHGNGRRHDAMAPTSVACALLIHVFSKKLHFPTLYWFCGLHASGLHGNPLGMLRGLISQLLCLSCCRCSPDDQDGLDTQDVKKLVRLFQKLLRRSVSQLPVICILDGLSFYETRHQSDGLGKIVKELADVARSDPPRLILLLTSPIRTNYISVQREIAERLTVAEIPDHVSGAKQGLNSRRIMSFTEKRARRLSESLELRRNTR
ncbi:MAG: hypothetical protein Q9197_002331 [Variospora fuerteventurae]